MDKKSSGKNAIEKANQMTPMLAQEGIRSFFNGET